MNDGEIFNIFLMCTAYNPITLILVIAAITTFTTPTTIMVFINEWLPNPMGSDAKGEFVELFNNGSAIDLNGWRLGNGEKKDFSLGGYRITGNGYLVLPRTVTKLTLKNSDASLFLYDAAGKLVDQSAYVGTAPEGQSFSRVNYGTDPSQHFAFTDPTPGAANKITANIQITNNQYPIGAPLNASFFGVDIFSATIMALALGLVLAGILIYSLKQDEDLSELFFGKHQEVW